MAALAAKAMGAAPVREKQALLETRRQQSKKAKSVLVGSSSRSVTSEQAGESRSLDIECITLVDGNTKEGVLKGSDGDMEDCLERLALQASSTADGTGGDVGTERAVGIDIFEAPQSKFCIRQYTEIVRQDRGDLKRSWPLAEEYLRGNILQGRVQVSLWPPIGAGESALSQAYRNSSYPSDVPFPHLFKLEIAFAESGVSEDKPDQSWITAEEFGIDKRVGSHVICSSDVVERRPSEEGACITRTKSAKAGRKISSTRDCSGDGEAQERPKKQDRLLRDAEVKHVEQVATAQTGSQRAASVADAKETVCVVERGVKQVRGDDTSNQVKGTGSPRPDLGVSVETGKGKRLADAYHSHVVQEKKTVDRSSKAQVLAENVSEACERIVGVGKGKAAYNSGSEVEGGLSSIRTNTQAGDSESYPKRGERELVDGGAIEKESVAPKRRNEDERILEERSSKSDGASASRPSTKRQSNKACPVCRSFSSMSQTTMNVHIDSCLVEHRQEEHIADPDRAETEPDPSREPSRDIARSKPVKSKGPGAKPKRKKRSIADIVANSVTRTLEESPGKEGVRFLGPYSRSADQLQDSKNLNWVSGNKKKRQPRNVPLRNLKEESESKRRRISRVESSAEESKPGKQEKRRLPEKEKEGITKPKQLRVERSAGPSTIITKSSKVQDGVDAESRRSGGRKTGVATPTSQLPSSRSGPGKGQVTHPNKESNDRDLSESGGPSQSRETRAARQEDIPTEVDEIAAKSLGITSPCKSPSSAVENPAPAAVKHRAGKAHSNSGVSTVRLASRLPPADRAPKAPWYPPAAMLRSGTISPILVTEAAVSTPIPELTSGTTKSPGSSLTAENLTDTPRIVPLAEISVSTRKSPRTTTLNSKKGQKGSRSLARESPLPIDSGDGAKTSVGVPSHKTSARVEVQNLAECRTSKEVDDYSDQTENAVEGMSKLILHSSNSRGGSRAVSVESPHQPSSTGAATDVISDKDPGNDIVGKSEGVSHTEKQREAAVKGRLSESVIAEEESVTAMPSEDDVTKLDRDPATRIVQEGCSTGPSGDINGGAGNTPEPPISRMRKRGGSKAKSRNFPDKTNGKGKRASIGGVGHVEETNVQLALPSIDGSGETPTEENQRKEDKLKQEHQRKQKKRQAVGTAVEPTFKWSSDTVQPAFQDMVVRRIEGVMGLEKGADQKSLKVVGREKRVDLVISSTNNVSSPSVNQEKGKEESTAQVQNSTYKFQLQRPEEALDSMARLRFGRDAEVSTSSSQIREVISQVDDGGANAQVAMEDIVQSQSPQTWSLVPQRPVGRKKLPIKCTARSVGSANAANQISGHSSRSSTSNQGAKSIESSGPEGPENGSSTGDVRTVNNAIFPVAAPKPPVSRSRAARQLAKSLPGSKKCAPHGEVVSPQVQPLIPANAVADPNPKEKSDNMGSTLINPDQQALLSPSSSWVTNPVRVQPSMSFPPERVSTDAFTPRNGIPEPIPEQTRRSEDGRKPGSVEIGSNAHRIPLADELHCTETLFSSPQSNAELDMRERNSNISTSNQLRDKGSSNVEVPKDTETVRNVQEEHSSKLDASVNRVTLSQQGESGFSRRRSPDQSGPGNTSPVSNVHKLNDKDSSESARASKHENCLPTVFSSTVGGSRRASSSTRSPGKVLEAGGRSKPDTAGTFQTLDAGPATFTSGLANTNVRLATVIPKAASTTPGLNTQLGQGRQNSSGPAVGSTRVSACRLNSTTAEAGCFHVANARPVMSTAASLPTSFTSLLQSTTLPPQSSAALSLAMQGTRPLQEACADRSELSRAGVMVSSRGITDPPRRTLDGLTWVVDKDASGGNDVSVSGQIPTGTAFFRPPPEMGGPSKASKAGDKELSRLPGWMRAAYPKGSESGAIGTMETEHSLTEAVKGLTGSPEGGEMSGPVRVRLWGRDVVVPPNEESTTGNPPIQQSPYRQRSETKGGAGTSSDTVASGGTSSACLDGVPVNAQAGLKVNPGPAAPRVGEGVAESSHQITVPAINTSNSVVGVVGSKEAVSVFCKSSIHQAQNYLSRLDYSNHRTPYTANSKEEMRISRAAKGQTSAALSTTPPEVIIIDDSAESPAKSGESFSGEGLTMAFLLDCGALRYLPATQNGRSGSQLMEVDPSKIPQRLVNQNFNILAELRKIGLVPAPKAVLPASYRHSHSLSLEVPHCNPPPASRAGSDVLPPWLLAEKKRKEAQIAENLIVLDDDDEPPTGTAVSGERRSLSSAISPGGSSGQPHPTGLISSSTTAKSGSGTRVTERSTGAVRTSALSVGATAISVPTTSHAGVHMHREAGSSPHGNESPAAQKSISRKNDLVVSDMVRPGVDTAHLNANTASDSILREKSGLQGPAASKEHPVGLQTGSGLSPAPIRRHREDNRTDKEKQLQVSDLQNEKKTPKGGTAGHKSGPAAAVIGGQGGPSSKKGSGQGISILAPTWMSGNNGWPKRGAAAQACKQAVERLKAQILSSPNRDGTSQAGPGGVLDFESHMIGQSPEKATNLAGSLSSTVSCMQNISSPATQGGFRYSSLSSRSGGDHDVICSSKEAPHNGRGVGQSPTPGTFTLAVVAAERDVSTVSKSPGVPSVVLHSTVGIQGEAQGTEGNQGRSSNTGVKTLGSSGSDVLDGKMSNLLVQSTPTRESSTSEQSSPTFSPLGQSGSSSPTLRSRAMVATKTVNEASSAILARGAMQSEQGSLLSMQATSFSRLPPSRLSLPLHGASVSTSSTKALLEQVCFTTKAASDSFTREVSNLQATMEQPTGRVTSPQKRIQPSRLKSIAHVNGGNKSAANPVSGVPAVLSSATIITPSSTTQSRPLHGFPSSCSPSATTTDQRMQLESGVRGVVNLDDGTTVVGGLDGAGTGTSRSPTSDLQLSSVFGRFAQNSSSNSSPRSSQGRYTSRSAAINPCDGGTWNLCGQSDAGDQASGRALSDHSPGSGIIPGYRLAPQIARAMVGHSQTPRATSPSSPISCGFFGPRGNVSVEHTSKSKDSDSSPRSGDSDCIAISAPERYSYGKSSREEKMKDARRESPKFTTTETAEKIRTKSLNSI